MPTIRPWFQPCFRANVLYPKKWRVFLPEACLKKLANCPYPTRTHGSIEIRVRRAVAIIAERPGLDILAQHLLIQADLIDGVLLGRDQLRATLGHLGHALGPHHQWLVPEMVYCY